MNDVLVYFNIIKVERLLLLHTAGSNKQPNLVVTTSILKNYYPHQGM